MPEIDPLQALLMPHVDRLKASAAAGNGDAQRIIDLYNMYVRCPEQGARTFCECYFRDWLRNA